MRPNDGLNIDRGQAARKPQRLRRCRSVSPHLSAQLPQLCVINADIRRGFREYSQTVRGTRASDHYNTLLGRTPTRSYAANQPNRFEESG